MGKLTVFNFITLNGCYKGSDGDTSWHSHGAEENIYSEEMLAQNNILLFGRVTYELMRSFWPTPDAAKIYPVVAEGMNKAEKIVFSSTMTDPGWNNARIVSDLESEVRKLKEGSKDLALLGSGTILTQLAEQGLIDGYELMIDPIVIANGTPIFNNIQRQLKLRHTTTRTFKSGVVVLCYEPA
jgi:dihydrofolate reductase